MPGGCVAKSTDEKGPQNSTHPAGKRKRMGRLNSHIPMRFIANLSAVLHALFFLSIIARPFLLCNCYFPHRSPDRSACTAGVGHSFESWPLDAGAGMQPARQRQSFPPQEDKIFLLSCKHLHSLYDHPGDHHTRLFINGCRNESDLAADIIGSLTARAGDTYTDARVATFEYISTVLGQSAYDAVQLQRAAAAHCCLQLFKSFCSVHSCNSPHLHVNWRRKAGPAIPFPPCRFGVPAPGRLFLCFLSFRSRFRLGSRTVHTDPERPHRRGRCGRSYYALHPSRQLRQSAEISDRAMPCNEAHFIRGEHRRHIPGAAFALAWYEAVVDRNRNQGTDRIFVHVVTFPFSLFVVYFSHARV